LFSSFALLSPYHLTICLFFLLSKNRKNTRHSMTNLLSESCMPFSSYTISSMSKKINFLSFYKNFIFFRMDDVVSLWHFLIDCIPYLILKQLFFKHICKWDVIKISFKNNILYFRKHLKTYILYTSDKYSDIVLFNVTLLVFLNFDVFLCRKEGHKEFVLVEERVILSINHVEQKRKALFITMITFHV
jgi:hypothetical protein